MEEQKLTYKDFKIGQKITWITLKDLMINQ